MSIVQSFESQLKFRDDTYVRAETRQGRSAPFDSLTRDIRLAGACLPTKPFFVPIGGVNNGTRESRRESRTLRGRVPYTNDGLNISFNLVER